LGGYANRAVVKPSSQEKNYVRGSVLPDLLELFRQSGYNSADTFDFYQILAKQQQGIHVCFEPMQINDVFAVGSLVIILQLDGSTISQQV
jgi:hypothetical protein